MIKILFFIPGLSEGGAEKVLCNLVNNMNQTEFDITVQTIDNYDATSYLVPGIHYKAINHQKTKLGKKLFAYWFRLCAELKLAYRFFLKGDYDIEIAYLETIATKIIAQSTNRKAGKIAWVHCDLSKKEGMKEAVKKVKNQYRKYDKIVCVSEDVRNGFYKLFGKDFDTVVLHNVINEVDILQKARMQITTWGNNDKKKLLAVGRLTRQKNFSYLIDTCARLRDDGFLFQLSILGEGPERENLENQIEKLKLTEHVKLRGYTDNPYVWMKNADAVICSSRYEGISTVVLEALILGKTVITTPCSGMKELLGESEFGMIASNSEEGLYECIRKFMEDTAVQAHYEEMALERQKNFSPKRVLAETETLFCELKSDL